MEERELRALIDQVRRRRAQPARLRADDGRARPHGAAGGADAGLGRRRPRPGQVRVHADQAWRRRAAEGLVVAVADACSIRISRPAPRTRTARGSSTSRWRRSIPTANLVRPRRRIPSDPERAGGEGRQVATATTRPSAARRRQAWSACTRTWPGRGRRRPRPASAPQRRREAEPDHHLHEGARLSPPART